MKSLMHIIATSRLFLLLALLAPAIALANPASVIVDPEQDYVTSGTYPNDMKPTSDKVIRLDLDLNGNGNPVVFLSYKNFTDRSGQIWVAYTPTNGGYQRVDLSEDGHLIQFLDGFYAVGKIKGIADHGGLTVLYPGKGGANVVLYDIRNGKATVKELPPIDYNKEKDKKDWLEGILKWKTDERGERKPDYSKSPHRVLSAEKIKAHPKGQAATPDN